ncbi:MAG: DUF4124 domain-containing protein [Candidatus Competibacter sp.]|nr:DUF4124 domain-containing protein [Candidatus Competibacter sp.]MDG4605753.1 DUF4124 domain-containing protein [Candidatus Contendobacter sp.]HRD50400.1 DUF4124 domain-containing protein [Candidatus Contendobacter sp.]
MLKQALLLLAVSCCGAAVIAQTPPQQTIYKWTDDQGKLQYSEVPPPTGVAYEAVRKPGVAIQGESALSSQQAREREELARQEAERKQQAEKIQQEAQDQRVKNCEIAKKNVQVLQGDSQIVKTDASGQKVVIDAQQREAELKKAQKDADYFCNP